jgi:chromosome partitioning protein
VNTVASNLRGFHVIASLSPLSNFQILFNPRSLENYQKKGWRGAQRWALVLSQIDTRRSLDKQFMPQLAQRYPHVPRFIVHQDTTLSLAAAEQVPLMDYAANSRGAAELAALAEWITRHDKFSSGTSNG